MFTLLIRSAVLYLLVFCIVRLMGKRQISDMQPFDLVITLLIADLASAPISDGGIPLFYGVIPILTLFILHRAAAFISLRSQKVRGFVCGHPIIVIEKGQVNEEALRAANYTLNDLMEQLRLKDVFSLSPDEVSYAILETNGSLSVLKNQGSSPAEPAALLINDGKPDDKALEACGMDRKALLNLLAKNGIGAFKNCFFACRLPDGKLMIQPKARANRVNTVLTVDLKEPKRD